MDKEAFTRVMRAVVAEHFPEELVAFDIGAARQIDVILAGGGGAAKPDTTGGEFKFDVASVEHVLKFIVLCGSAFGAAKTLTTAIHAKLTQHERENKLASEWRLRLMEAGIPVERATAIASSFSRDLTSVTRGGGG